MTESEAIKELHKIRPRGGIIPQKRAEALDVAIQALEKQMPKKPRKTDSYRGVLKRVYAYACPTCHNVCLEKYMNERQNTTFCWDCGQHLDWSDENADSES